MIDNLEIFSKNVTSLKRCSRIDSSSNCLVDCNQPAINFDKVKEEYVRAISLNGMPCSLDALYIHENRENAVFIEFKSGDILKCGFSIEYKVYDSLLIFNALINRTIEYTREKVELILVYNASKNGRISIGTALGKKSAQGFEIPKLSKFEKYCFRKVHVVEASEFEKSYAAIVDSLNKN